MLLVAQRAFGAPSRKAHTRRQVASPQLHQRSVPDSACTQKSKTSLCVAIAALRKCKERIGSLEQAKSLNGVGEKTAQKVTTAVLSLHRSSFVLSRV
jgi:hypothetical protein